jgi:hypothetical protein
MWRKDQQQALYNRRTLMVREGSGKWNPFQGGNPCIPSWRCSGSGGIQIIWKKMSIYEKKKMMY